MSKTAPIPDDIHELIVDKQIELKRKHKISLKISDIIAACVKDSINKMGKLVIASLNDEQERGKPVSVDNKEKDNGAKTSEILLMKDGDVNT